MEQLWRTIVLLHPAITTETFGIEVFLLVEEIPGRPQPVSGIAKPWRHASHFRAVA